MPMWRIETLAEQESSHVQYRHLKTRKYKKFQKQARQYKNCPACFFYHKA